MRTYARSPLREAGVSISKWTSLDSGDRPRIEETCRHCGRLMIVLPWFVECADCQQKGRKVTGRKIARAA